jgi:hypothetical protein
VYRQTEKQTKSKQAGRHLSSGRASKCTDRQMDRQTIKEKKKKKRKEKKRKEKKRKEKKRKKEKRKKLKRKDK